MTIIKRNLTDLAAFGGAPAFQDPLHVGRPNIGNRARLLERIEDLLSRKWLTNNGPYVQEFENHICEITGAKHCIAMCNGTIALELAIRALELSGEVIVPSFTFIATAHALQWQQITPVFCDINPQSHTIDPNRVEELITPRTSGIIGVHLWGRACDADALEEIAERRNLRLIFDAAHAFACSSGGRMIGNFGEAEVFSFHATKFLNASEGGAVVTNNGERMVGESGGDQDDLAKPKSDAQIEQKFRGLTEEILGAKRVDAILERLWHLEGLTNVAEIPPAFVLA